MMRTRFAPSPTGPLHLGHAYSAILAHDMARTARGQFLLRIEDIDRSRSRAEWESQIQADLSWLGLRWDGPVLRQSDRQAAYDDALDDLWARGLIYPCKCNRRDIAAAAAAPNEGEPPMGPDGIIYPGTCRPSIRRPGCDGPRPRDVALRLDIRAALASLGLASDDMLHFTETGGGEGTAVGEIAFAARELIDRVGDVVLARREMGSSYHLAVVLDDAFQGITHVVRGADLFEATRIHVLLQRLFGLPTPLYHHHRLIRDENGKRLAKRDDARAIAKYREDGATPEDIRKMIGLPVLGDG